MTADEITAWTQLLATINASKWWIIAAILATACGAALSFFYYLHVKRREAQDADASKERRAKAYGSTMEALRTAIINQTDLTERTAQQTQDVITSLAGNVSRLVQSIRTMSSKMDGKMSRNDSARFIHHVFEQDLFSDVCAVAERSLRENDYVARSVYVRDKIRTAIGESLIDARNTLSSYPLSLNANAYFVVNPDHAGERFVLVDLLWAVLEPKFNHDAGILTHRIEEAYLAIENCLRDYTSRIYTQLMTTPAVSVEKYRTPTPSSKSDSDSNLVTLPTAPFGAHGSATASLLRRQRSL